jgi:hypothetical protein
VAVVLVITAEQAEQAAQVLEVTVALEPLQVVMLHQLTGAQVEAVVELRLEAPQQVAMGLAVSSS